MQFKYPEILYFLFLLVIPIIVHLFQLRRFKKEYFTNVRFLKNLVVQTRKSSQLKKWLLLVTRLLLLAALIIAFAQPFSDAKDSTNPNNNLFVILDNSFSMQAKGENGELLKRSVEDILTQIPEDQSFSILTNDQNYWDTDISSVQKELQQIQYSNFTFDLSTQIGKVNSRNLQNGQDILVITDAQNLKQKDVDFATKSGNVHFIIPQAQKQNNVSIDSVYINEVQDNFYDIAVNISAFGTTDSNISMSLINNDKVVAKTLLKLDKSKITVPFKIAKADFNGYVQIEDNGLEYDNTFYFSIEIPKKTSVLSIGEDQFAGFLKRIYNSEEFEYRNSVLKQLDYSKLQDQDVIILNEITEIPEALQTNLSAFAKDGGTIILIPSKVMDLQNGNSFVSKFGNYQFLKLSDQEKKVTNIAFDNSMYKGVFTKKVDNFEFPSTFSSFEIKSSAIAPLKYSDQSSFLSQLGSKNGKVYVFSASLNTKNSNFQNSPLIVPTFYNMAQAAANTAVTAIKIGSDQTFSAFTNLQKDAVVKVENKDGSFIPMQKVFNNKVVLSFSDNPSIAGNYKVVNNDQNIASVSFNYDRTESNLELVDTNLVDKLPKVDSIDSILSTLKTDRTDNSFWKLFIGLCLLFLLLEIAIQKFIK